jgi:hypothetical protein
MVGLMLPAMSSAWAAAAESRPQRMGGAEEMLTFELPDVHGRIVFKTNNSNEKDWIEVRQRLGTMLPKAVPDDSVTRDATRYRRETLRRSEELDQPRVVEHFPRIACGPDGTVYTVLTTNRRGNQDAVPTRIDP